MGLIQKVFVFLISLMGLIVICQIIYVSNHSSKRPLTYSSDLNICGTISNRLTMPNIKNEGFAIAKPPALRSAQSRENSKRIIVSGGAGFVGSHLVDALMNQGHHVIVLDNLFTGDRHNIDHWMKHPRFEFILHDVSKPICLEGDQIYHLASPASPSNYMSNPVETLKANLMGSINLLGLARRSGASFLLASTSEVYGDPEVHPQSESYWGNVNPTGVRSCYDESKRAAEALACAYSRSRGVPVRVARIFNTYGPRMQFNDGRVVSNFILQALSNQDICLYGDGSHTRSFMYISDLVEGLIRLMNSNFTGPVNLGNPQEFTIRTLANIVKDLTNSSSNVINCKEAIDDPKRRRPDITRAKTLLGWEPKIQLEEGLQLTIKALRESLNNATQLQNPKLKQYRLQQS